MIAEKDFAGRQSRGAREVQEDAYAFSEIAEQSGNRQELLIVVADGMGGHNAGERASELVLKTFIESFHYGSGPTGRRLQRALEAANAAITAELEREPAFRGMGTTLLATSITPTGMEWVSVGDSPLYLWREGALSRLNEDHSFRPILRDMSNRGEVLDPEAAAHVSRNILRAALTGDEIALIDRSKKPLALQDGDIILAASDGIHTLDDREIAEVFAESEAKEAHDLATRLLQAIAEASNPKQDNATIAVVRPRSEESLVLPL